MPAWDALRPFCRTVNRPGHGMGNSSRTSLRLVRWSLIVMRKRALRRAIMTLPKSCPARIVNPTNATNSKNLAYTRCSIIHCWAN